MKSLIKQLLLLISLSLSTDIFAYPEIPFCPAGGPPGWMNYLDSRHNQNRWHQQNYYYRNYPPASYYPNPKYRRFNSNRPAYNKQGDIHRTSNNVTYNHPRNTNSRHYYRGNNPSAYTGRPNYYRSSPYVPRPYAGNATHHNPPILYNQRR